MNPSSKKSNKTESIRIIAGRFRSRKIPVLDQTGLRPTTDRIRETLFNWLTPYLSNESIGLDLFAGSGALGFEALSRGVKRVIFVEKQATVFQHLKQTAQQLELNPTDILHQDALIYLDSTPKLNFDFIFIDPPFHQNLVQQAIDTLTKQDHLKTNSIIYIESELSLSVNTPINWRLIKEKTTKQLKAQLFKVL